MSKPSERLRGRSRNAHQSRQTTHTVAQLQRLRFSVSDVRATEQLCQQFPWQPQSLTGPALAQWLVAVGEGVRQQAMAVGRILSAARLLPKAPFRALERRIERMLGGGSIPSLRELAMDARTLTAAHIAVPGPTLGHLLRALHIWAVQHNAWHDQPRLLAAAKSLAPAAAAAAAG